MSSKVKSIYIDWRDLPQGNKTSTMTIPKKYGIRWAGGFLLINEIIAYTFCLAVYLTGLFSVVYLFCMNGTIILGLPLNFIYIFRSTPKMSRMVNMLSFGVLGMLYVIGMFFGRL